MHSETSLSLVICAPASNQLQSEHGKPLHGTVSKYKWLLESYRVQPDVPGDFWKMTFGFHISPQVYLNMRHLVMDSSGCMNYKCSLKWWGRENLVSFWRAFARCCQAQTGCNFLWPWLIDGVPLLVSVLVKGSASRWQLFNAHLLCLWVFFYNCLEFLLCLIILTCWTLAYVCYSIIIIILQ